VLIPQLKARLFGGAAVAGATLVMSIVTMVIAQNNLQSALLGSARETGALEGEKDTAEMSAVLEGLVHTELGFWLIVVALTLILIGNLGAALRTGRPLTRSAARSVELAGLPFPPDGPDDEDGTSPGQPRPSGSTTAGSTRPVRRGRFDAAGSTRPVRRGRFDAAGSTRPVRRGRFDAARAPPYPVQPHRVTR
jgi:hypothetical protein